MEFKIVDATPIEGLRRVMANNKYGVIDSNNNLICEILYDSIGLDVLLASEKDIIYDKRIKISKNGLKGYIDLNGKIIIPPQFYDAESFDGLYAQVSFQNEDYYDMVYYNLIDRYGNLIFHNGKYPEFIRFYGDKQQYALVCCWTLMNKNNNKKERVYWWYFHDLEKKFQPPPQFIYNIIGSTNYPIVPNTSTTIKIMTEKTDYIVDVFKETVINIDNLSLPKKIKRMLESKNLWK
jgi:hypothetical protein